MILPDTYDSQMNVISITDPLGRASETYTLDANERIISATNLEGQTMSMDYLVGNHLGGITRFDGTEISFDYHDSGELASVTYPDDTITYTYDRDGLPLTVANATGAISNEYNEAAWLVKTTTGGGPSAGSEINYEYFPAGQIASIESLAGTTTYALDNADRIAEIVTTTATTVNHSPSTVNRSYALGIGDRLASANGDVFQYNLAGCVTGFTRNGVSYAFVWNSQYQLTSVSTNGVFAESYTCDPLGRRASTTTSEETVFHIYNGIHCIADTDESGNLLKTYTYGTGVDNLLAVTIHNGNVRITYHAPTACHAITEIQNAN